MLQPSATNSRAFTIAEAATQKLAKLVENHPQFHSSMEQMLQDIYKELELRLSAAFKRQKNEESSAIYKLSNDELKLCFGNLGEYQYRNIAGTSHRFKQVYDDVVGDEKRTSINIASMSVSCAKVCLAERSCHQQEIVCHAAVNGKVEVLAWAHDSGYALKRILKNSRFRAVSTYDVVAQKGHLHVVKFMSNLGIMPFTVSTFASAAKSGNLDLL